MPVLTWEYIINCSTINGCIWSDLFNFGQDYFYRFLDAIEHLVYHVSINNNVITAGVWLIFLMLLLSFAIGFIFFVKK